MDPYWSSSEYFWQLSPGNGQFLVGFGIDGNWAWFCELLLTSFYQPLKLWRCVKRRPISIVQLFADQMKNIFCPIDDFFDTHNWSSCFEVLNSFQGIRSFFAVYVCRTLFVRDCSKFLSLNMHNIGPSHFNHHKKSKVFIVSIEFWYWMNGWKVNIINELSLRSNECTP